jgi:hypothetical protein
MEDKQKANALESKETGTEVSGQLSPQRGGSIFEILVKGQLNDNWSDWLEGMEVKLLDNGEMMLVGPVVDQAALMGILNKLSFLNLKLLSVNELIK